MSNSVRVHALPPPRQHVSGHCSAPRGLLGLRNLEQLKHISVSDKIRAAMLAPLSLAAQHPLLRLVFVKGHGFLGDVTRAGSLFLKTSRRKAFSVEVRSGQFVPQGAVTKIKGFNAILIPWLLY